MNIKLSNRLQYIADLVPQGSRLADIGSDHALLPVFLAKQERVPFAVAGEVNQGPYDAARRQVRATRLEQVVDVRKGNGLAVIQPGEIDCVTIAGMGGSLIVQILSADESKLTGVSRLVLQPNVGEELVRQWLRDNGWALIHEHILEEDGKIYEILHAERSDADHVNAALADAKLYAPRKLSNGITLDEQWLLKLGPMLSVEATDVFVAKWKSEIKKQERVLHTMAQTDAEEVAERRALFAAKKAELEAIVECLQKDKR
ncbi:tRNA (adenine(22)-N(1))-methyltransferase [Paenibacillus sp. 481]|uniref:tRNA (adenine(22)-N(1))-methyltransferase n=1 Tax=Paenibacillus sp. 481 TaxID=2835869 RepID=UPI001E485F61|nr:class I SAM-dependent methyltransferase [Paenibacillus sp. 481]UHA74156.1 tRNA (adenine(22)-N(1))-methyltransferase TrmK [Paenibacillus sp. 481]